MDAYYFAGKAGQQFSFGVQIPDLEDLQNYEVTVALFGPDLPEADESQLPPDHPEDLGALIFPSIVTENFFESFTQTNYLGRQKITTTLPADGDYYLIVWHPESLAGKYVLDSGRAEYFTPGDLFLFPVWWIQVRVYFGQGPVVARHRRSNPSRGRCHLTSTQEKMTSLWWIRRDLRLTDNPALHSHLDEFYAQTIYHFKHVTRTFFNPAIANIKWRNNERNVNNSSALRPPV